MAQADSTEMLRLVAVLIANNGPDPVDGIDTATLTSDYEVLGFLAPFVAVKRKSDGVVGSFTFRHSPRVYFDFIPD